MKPPYHWNLPLFILFLLAGPGVYGLLELLQPSKLLVMAVIFGVPVSWIVIMGAVAFARALYS